VPLSLLVTRYGPAEQQAFESTRAASDGSAGRPFLGEYGALAYLGKEHRFAYLPSLSALASQRLYPKQYTGPRQEFTAFADPIFAPPPGQSYSPATRAALGLPPGASVALFFGFVRPYKGLVHLIDALPLAVSRVPDLRLVVAGECWGSPAPYLDRAAALGVADRVRFDDGYIPNERVGIYFAAADVVVLPYVEASQSGVVTQAAEALVPSIVTRVGGLPEAVEDGVSGLVVPPGNAGALADALARVLGDPAMGDRLRAGVAATRSRFSWDGVVDLIEDLADHPVSPTAPTAGAREADAGRAW